MSDITHKIRWLLKTTNPEPLMLVLEEEEIAELASQWDTTVKGDGSMAFEGVRIVSKTNYNLNNLGANVETTVEEEYQKIKSNKAQVLTPGQALDWARGLSHQALDVEYLIGSDGEAYYPSDILEHPEVVVQLVSFVADSQLVDMSAYELTQLCSLCFKLGEDGESRKMFKKVLTTRLEKLGFENIEMGKDSVP